MAAKVHITPPHDTLDESIPYASPFTNHSSLYLVKIFMAPLMILVTQCGMSPVIYIWVLCSSLMRQVAAQMIGVDSRGPLCLIH